MTVRNSISNLVTGSVIFITTIVAWLYASQNDIDPGPLFFIAGPVIGALFLASPLSRAADSAQQAAIQTNGGMKSTVKAAVSEALGERDAARTRQAVGDVSADILPTVSTGTDER